MPSLLFRRVSSLLSICLPLVCVADSPAPVAVVPVRVSTDARSCSPTAWLPLASGVVLNNQWNRASAGADGKWLQCLQQRLRDGVVESGWTWSWPRKDGLYAYPEALVGRSPWMSTPTNDARFPRTLDTTERLIVDFDFEMTSSGKRNLALEFWFTNAPLADGQPDVGTIKTELMIWTDASAGVISADDHPIATVRIDDMDWEVRLKQNWGDATGNVQNRWSLITYHALQPATAMRLDARKFMQDAIDRGVLAPSDTVAGVEIGNEIVSGSGSTWIRKLVVETN